MKMVKITALFLALIMLVGVLASCGNSATDDTTDTGEVAADNSGNGNEQGNDTTDGMENDSSTLTGTVTLKQFLDSGPKVGFEYSETPNKNGSPAMLLFEDGKMYSVCPKTNNYGLPYHYWVGHISWGEISKMTDEELLEYARKYKASEWCVENTSKSYDCRVSGNYNLHIYTDNTGNNFEYEKLEYNVEVIHTILRQKNSHLHTSLLFDSTSQAVVYDSTFTGLKLNRDDYTLYFRTGENLTITPDNIGDEGVEVD